MRCGYHGKLLRVDLSSRTYELQELAERLLRDFIGGVGVNRAELDLMIAACYRVRSWRPDGLIPEAKLRDLGLWELVRREARALGPAAVPATP